MLITSTIVQQLNLVSGGIADEQSSDSFAIKSAQKLGRLQQTKHQTPKPTVPDGQRVRTVFKQYTEEINTEAPDRCDVLHSSSAAPVWAEEDYESVLSRAPRSTQKLIHPAEPWLLLQQHLYKFLVAK